MKIKLYGVEKAEVVKKYNPFTLDSQEFPQLELEISKVIEASAEGSTLKTESALEDLYIKMYDTQAKGSFADGTEYTTDLMSVVDPFQVEHDEIWPDDSVATFKLIEVEED